MDMIIGVDGGGTKTEAVAYDFFGRTLAQGRSGHGNVLVDEKQAVMHILDAVKQCLSVCPTWTCVKLILGLAGSDSGANRQKLETALSSLGIPFCIMNDAELAHAAALKGQDGILTISGTGSISYGLKGAHFETSGGWGHLLGDEGSGYWLVMAAFKQMIRDDDAGAQVAPLSAALLEKIGVRRPTELKSFVYVKEKGAIAALVPVIVAAAQAGDARAQQLLKDAGVHLAKMTMNLHRRMAFDPQASIAIRGGVLTQIAQVKASFANVLKAQLPQAQLIEIDDSATRGAYYLMKKNQNKASEANR